jgi:hypothetical protein
MNKFTKQMLMVVAMLISFWASGQNLISPITINIPANPPANMAEWATAVPPVMILAQTKLVNGQINGMVQESRILVTIKSAGNKVCGTYTAQTAPMSNFNSATKNWTGANVLSLLGQECILKPGSYELCVQFYSFDLRVLGESCKPFNIEEKKQESFSPPQNVFPNNEKSFKETEVKAPITFRWTPIVPKPKEPVVYRLRVWQLMQGQNSMNTMRSNTPIVEKEVTNVTQAVVNNLYTGPCKPPYLCDYIWTVEALSKDATQGASQKSFGTSEPTTFKIIVDESNPGSCLRLDTSKYSIVCVGQDQNGKFRYKVQNLFVNKIAGNTDPFMESGTTVSNINYITAVLPASVLIQNVTPLSFTGITAAVSPAIGFEFVSATALTSFTANLSAYTYHLSAAGSKIYCQKNFEMTFDVPSCRCNLCDSSIAKWEIQSEIKYDSTATNNILTLHNDITFSPYKVVKLSAEIVDFYWYTEGDCKKCNNNDYYFGNLVSGTISGSSFTNTGTSVAGPGGTPIPSSHQLDFIANTLAGANLNNDLYLNISLPPQTQLSCCTDCFRFCIRYTVTFMQGGVCKTCSIVKCYESKRKHRKVGKQININACGESGVIIANGGGLGTSVK